MGEQELHASEGGCEFLIVSGCNRLTVHGSILTTMTWLGASTGEMELGMLSQQLVARG